MNFKVSTIGLALAHAHMSMVEPEWNYGTADTSGCAAIYKRTAGANAVLYGIMHTVDALSSDERAFVECRWMQNRASMWFNHGTQNGCTNVTGQVCGAAQTPGHEKPCCEQPMEPTLTAPELLTFSSHHNVSALGGARFNPWFAPGHAPVLDPCGVVGGYKWNDDDLYFAGPDKFGSNESCRGCVVNGAPAPAGLQFKAGTHGSELFHRALVDPVTAAIDGEAQPVTTWTAGGVAEVKQGAMYANHGGGYQWRLCPADTFSADGAASEECFQSMPLDYATRQSWVEFNGDAQNRTAFDAVRVTDLNTEGVQPTGSTWTRFAVPNCGPGDDNNNCQKLAPKSAATTRHALSEFGHGTVEQHSLPSYLNAAVPPLQPPALNFAEPAKGVHGYGRADYSAKGNYLSTADNALDTWAAVKKHYDFTVVDKVRVPARAGRYVLSWRWDAEQTPQVWGNCALVDIVDRGSKGHSNSGPIQGGKPGGNTAGREARGALPGAKARRSLRGLGWAGPA